MITRGYPQTRRGLLSVTGLTAALVGAALSMLSPRVAAAQAFPAHCAGTYLIELLPARPGPANLHLWTLTKDGALLGTSNRMMLSNNRGTSNTQPGWNFSNAQGVWEQDGDQGIKAVWLDFSFDPDSGEMINVTRRDITLHTVGYGCDNVAGTTTQRRFEAGTSEDPLDPTSDTGEPFIQTFTGRRVKVSP
jgi:hypothetical protein